MSDTPTTGGSDDHTGPVLRPFQAPVSEPLPPVEPSKVVPQVETTTEELEPIEALADEPFSIDATDLDEVWSPSAIDAPVVPAPPSNDVSADDLSDPLLDRGAVDVDESGDAARHDDADLEPVTVASETITLPRKGFLIGLGAIGVVILLLVALWQTAGGDGDTITVTPDNEVVAPVATDDVAPDDVAPDDVAPDQTPVANAGDTAGLKADLADAEATVASLEAVVADLESRPPPALPGNAMRRIVVGADANFISAQDDSIAVVGSFGGLSLIDPETNRVVANGKIADSANRVLRTQSSVWITDYQDNQLLQVDPGTNTVENVYPIPGPDGLAKLDNTLAVASFDASFVARVDPGTGDVLQWVDVGGRPTDVHTGAHGLWAAVYDTGELVRLHPDTLSITERVVVGAGPVGIGSDATHLWVTNNDEGTVAKVDPETAEVVFTVAVGQGPAGVVSIEGSVWVTVSDDGTLVQIDANDGDILSVTPLGGAIAGGGPTGIAYGAGALWIAMQGEQSVVKIEL